MLGRTLGHATRPDPAGETGQPASLGIEGRFGLETELYLALLGGSPERRARVFVCLHRWARWTTRRSGRSTRLKKIASFSVDPAAWLPALTTAVRVALIALGWKASRSN